MTLDKHENQVLISPGVKVMASNMFLLLLHYFLFLVLWCQGNCYDDYWYIKQTFIWLHEHLHWEHSENLPAFKISSSFARLHARWHTLHPKPVVLGFFGTWDLIRQQSHKKRKHCVHILRDVWNCTIEPWFWRSYERKPAITTNP